MILKQIFLFILMVICSISCSYFNNDDNTSPDYPSEQRDQNGVLLYESLKFNKTSYSYRSTLLSPKSTMIMGPYAELNGYHYSGKIIKYYPNKQVEFQGEYDLGSKSGNWIYFYKDGQIKEQYHLKKDTDDCMIFYKSLYPNGQVKKEFKIDSLERYSCNDTIFRKTYYQNGEPHELSYNHINQYDFLYTQKFRNDGKIFKHIKYDSIHIIKDSASLSILEEGKFNKHGRQIGNWKYYNINEQLIQSENYKNGYLDGAYIKNYPSGGKQIRGKYKNDEKEGKWSVYYKNGNLKSVTHYLKNKKDGKYTEYFENGKPYIICYFKRNKHNGYFTEYSAPGIKSKEGEFFSDERIGTWKYYDSEGKFQNDREFD